MQTEGVLTGDDALVTLFFSNTATRNGAGHLFDHYFHSFVAVSSFECTVF